MPNKKTKPKHKRVTIKEIVDAFYSGVHHKKVSKMAQRLVEQERIKDTLKSIRER